MGKGDGNLERQRGRETGLQLCCSGNNKLNIGPLLTLLFWQIVIVLGYTYISSTAASVSPHCVTFSRTF